MLSLLNLRKSLASVLICSLLITGLLTFTTRQSHASNNSLMRSLNPGVNETSDETGPQTKMVDEATRSRVNETLGKLPLSFEENRGQVDTEVKYLARGAGYTLFLTPTEAVLALQSSNGKKTTTTAADARRPPVPAQPRPVRTSVLRMKLKGANRSPAVTGESQMGVRTNYFIGNDPEKWNTDVARYERVRYSQVYPGVDLIYYGQQQSLEYDFEVAPGADSRRIALEFAGVKRVKIERETGELILKTAGGEVRQHKPVAYQEVGGERREVESRYVMQGKGKVGIEVGEYDRTQRLVIDPVLSYSTYLGGGINGGSGSDTGQGIAVDASGIAYVTGYTSSHDFPTLNQYQIYEGGSVFVFVTKLDTNASGTAALLYSTYLGGRYSGQTGNGIAVDASGIAYVTGTTGAYDFPILNQYQTFQGLNDVFVAKLDTNASGTASLLYSTCLGGYGNDDGWGIAIDASGIAYVTGSTYTTNFPTLNEYQTDQDGADVFVTKLDTNASGTASLLYSTYLGGSGGGYLHPSREIGTGIAVDSSGHAYVTGYTESLDFPTLNQYQTYQGDPDLGILDAFVTKIDTNASGAASLLYSTYLGGSGDDYSHGIAVDASGNVYVTGETGSSDFPTLNQFQTDPDSAYGYYDVFVTKLDPNASGAASLLYSTYLGGDYYDGGFGITVDASGNAYVTGYTFSSDFPTLNQYQTRQGSGPDVFVTKISTNASGTASLLYSTYLGGSVANDGYGIAVDASGNIYVAGETGSYDFPTLNQYQASRIGLGDAFVTKFTNNVIISGRVTSDGSTGINGVTVTLTNATLSLSTTTASDGSYSFSNLPTAANYKIKPTLTGYTFSPTDTVLYSVTENQPNVNFIATSISTPPANVSGHVTLNTATGAAFAGVTITLTGGSGFTPLTTTTASDGSYSFSSLPTPGTYTLTPSKTNYTFSPTPIVLTNLRADQTNTNFIARLKNYTVSGVVKLGAAGLSGVTVTLSSSTPAGFASRTSTTDSTGAYSLTNIPAERDYTVTPTKPGYQFTPASKSLTNLSANQTAVNFAVTVYSISGRITRTGTTTGISAVTVTLTSPMPANFPARTAQTGPQGNYQFTVLPAGRDYTIEPMKTGFTFTPATQSITNLSSNIPAGTSTNFTGTGP